MLNDLNVKLSEVNREHPYNLGSNELDRLEAIAGFVQGSSGLLAVPNNGEFLYRICGVMSVVNRTAWQSSFGGHDVGLQIFEQLTGDYDSLGETWLPLSRYAQGVLTGYRDFTWWTSLETLNEDLIRGALLLGLLWIPELALLLRCPADYVIRKELARVPTVIDGFISEVFHATADSDNPNWGVTISLENSDDLCQGSDEYVLGPIRVEEISLRPIWVNDRMRAGHAVESGSRLWGALESYYNRL